MKKFQVNEAGFYGAFGGAYIPEVLKPCIDELRAVYRDVIGSREFQMEFRRLLQTYAGRPSPLYLSPSLSRQCGGRVYLKREDLNHTGAHKINNALGQALLARHLGKRRVIAETGAGQHGVATATVCALFGLPCTIYMGAVDVERQRPNVEKIRLLGATVCAVETGGATLQNAVDAALADWVEHPDETYYLIGSAVGPHPYPDMVARLQSVISEEIRTQLLELEGRDAPDCIVACIGGGSNASGTVYHFLEREEVRIVLAEAGGEGLETGRSAAAICEGREGVLHGAHTYVLQDAGGHVREPYSISAGLDYPGIGPLPAYMAQTGRAEVVAVTDEEALRAAYALIRNEGIFPALESAHALGALARLRFRPDEVVVATLSGRGDKDADTYLKYATRYAAL